MIELARFRASPLDRRNFSSLAAMGMAIAARTPNTAHVTSFSTRVNPRAPLTQIGKRSRTPTEGRRRNDGAGAWTPGAGTQPLVVQVLTCVGLGTRSPRTDNFGRCADSF